MGLFRWIRVLFSEDGTVQSNPLGPGTEYKDDTQAARVVIDVVWKRYAEESARSKDLDGKATPLLGFATAILVLSANALTKTPDCVHGTNSIIYTSLIVVGLIVLGVAQFILLRALAVKDYKAIDLDYFADLNQTQRPPEEIRELLEYAAGTYTEATGINKVINDDRADQIAMASKWLIAGGAILAVAFIFPGCGLPQLW